MSKETKLCGWILFWVILVGCVLVSLVVTTLIGFKQTEQRLENIETQLESIPRRVCHIEEKLGKFVVNETRNFPYDSEILCEDGVDVHSYGTLEKKVIYGYSWERGKTCLVKTEQEICEIK